MATTEIDSLVKDALWERLATGRPLDPDVYRRIRERQEAITEELRKRNGQMNIAVELIREGRDEV